MKPYEPESSEDHQLKKLESHIKGLPEPSLPPSWKLDILSAAQQKAVTLSATGTEDLIQDRQPAWLSVLSAGFRLITPVRATIAAIWLFALCGAKFDTWLNGKSDPNTSSNHSSTPYTSLSDQLMQWEMAGLEATLPENDTAPTKHQQTPPGPRSRRKPKNSPFTLHHS